MAGAEKRNSDTKLTPCLIDVKGIDRIIITDNYINTEIKKNIATIRIIIFNVLLQRVNNETEKSSNECYINRHFLN